MNATLSLNASVVPAWPAAAPAASATDRVGHVLLWCVFLSVTVLQRFAITAGGEAQIALGFAVSMVPIALLVATRRLVISSLRLVAFCGMAAAILLSLVLGDQISNSVSSLALLLVIGLLYVFQFRADLGADLGLDPARIFRTLMTILAVVGIAQFFLQFVVPSDFAFPIDAFVPEAVLMRDFNTLNPLYYGSPILKANGVVLLEASHFSQFVAIALIIELMRFRSPLRIALYALALFVAFSGTGLSLVALFGPLVLIRQGKIGLLLIGVLALAILFSAGEMVHLSLFTDRLAEFGSTRSSGFARFVGPFWFMGEYLFNDPQHLFFGMGGGSITPFLKQAAYFTHDTSWAKLLFEYGLVGFVAFLGYFLICAFDRTSNAVIAGMATYTFLLLGGYLLATYMHLLFLALSVWHRPAPATPTLFRPVP